MKTIHNKEYFSQKAQKIAKDIYLYPIIIIVVTLTFFFITLYNSIESFKTEQKQELSQKLLEKEKKDSKEFLQNIVTRIEKEKQNTEKQLKTNLKNRIYEAKKIIENILKENKGKSKQELKKLVSNALSPIRFFNNRGYYLVYDKDTKRSVIHPVKKFIGKDMSKFRDKKGQLLVQLYDETIKETGEGFANIYFVKPHIKDSKEYKKIVFVKSIPELNWVIGTGDYVDEVEKIIQKDILDSIADFRYGNNGYFWIHNTDYQLLMHPFRKESIGKYDKELEDSKGTKIIQLFVNKALENKEGSFVQYYWAKPNSDKSLKKLSYVKHIPDWNWVIGTGVYLDDIKKLNSLEEKNYNNKIKNLYGNIAIFSILLLLIVIFISLRLSRNIQKEFDKYSSTLQKLNNSLEDKVLLRTKELNELNNSLENRVEQELEKNRYQETQLLEQAKFAQMGEMIGNIAHQWRQPLSIITTAASGISLKKEMNQLSDKELENFTEIIMTNANHLSHTIDHFRDFIKEKRELKEIIVQERIKEVLNIVESSLTNNHIKIKTDLNENTPIKIQLVLGELSQTLINLLTNSKDAFNGQDINDKWINIVCQNDNSKVVISVEDNAGGIDKEIINKIFDPYFTTKHQSNGTGIGLYMCKNIIEKNLLGKLYVSNTSVGAKFTIELPLKGLKEK